MNILSSGDVANSAQGWPESSIFEGVAADVGRVDAFSNKVHNNMQMVVGGVQAPHVNVV